MVEATKFPTNDRKRQAFSALRTSGRYGTNALDHWQFRWSSFCYFDEADNSSTYA
jgi:hypothetical protein